MSDVIVVLPGTFGAGLEPGPDWQAGNWRDRALCAETDPDAFFPEKGGSSREAVKVCLGCEVRAECLEFALENDERFGIWGGLSENARRRMRWQRGREAA
jgi:WhiB family transcriptional regulator, redox-sensing transcriptional regulator